MKEKRTDLTKNELKILHLLYQKKRGDCSETGYDRIPVGQ